MVARRVEPQVLVEVAGCIAQIENAVKAYPSLRPVVAEMMRGTTKAAAMKMGASGERPRRKMTPAQLKANSRRMKQRWKEAKKAGRTSL